MMGLFVRMMFSFFYFFFFFHFNGIVCTARQRFRCVRVLRSYVSTAPRERERVREGGGGGGDYRMRILEG